ncbi:D-beta-hydroxybutyrate dehydrogenase, mitochondrial [Bactrocera neohumeralis]|uniref:D-beta-hydroxybutyrate dehydrogenase, mitochondrial n=1 Tax=Bactrocera dorsalis TaxID=27457 RepID=A0A034WW19_BACDO|nr:D-beta-hydroxybutyrate dehydrogenase, mitochondrial [Bactrocera tryoni]XP_039957600.1 D-beta-hydroxybutyrate dehydrogenase, mitochondrial [Bactrocera tryoni]XP_049309884.1 D-beta-hydroxybutyrate dehydrogenase, mitochondrial [Bactrocera dorsalis]XP_050325889.1 D-beta-hydroxybutyrate dehydrogenase, mitochondrial [Bactrocera neohumeralis]XP_050325891.1 D-beta-hydroxybutyrate dehydrogenase, mitochondrial [Bactrocera neohumeralis]
MQVFDNTMRRASRRASLRRGSISVLPQKSAEIPWDILERLLLPFLFCHAAALIISTLLHALDISHVSTFAVFVWFALSTVGAVLFYHFVKVSSYGKGVLITGCETPIAWYLAKKLDDLGFTIYAGFNVPIAESDEAKILKEETSGRLKLLHVDVSSEKSLLEAAVYISEHLPDGAYGLWAVVHCAHWVALGELEWIPFGVLRKSLDLNLLGAARLTQIMLPLIRRSTGRVVFLTSGLSKIPAPVRGIQGATQAAIESFAGCLRQEMRQRGVDVSVVAAGEFTPGNGWLSETELREQAKEMWAQLTSEQKKTYGEDYYEAAMTSLEKYSRETADIQPALRVLIDAVSRTFPMARYTPVTAREKIEIFMAEHLPTALYEILFAEPKKKVRPQGAF